MKKLFNLTVWLGCSLLLTACTTLEYASYDRLQAAEISFPDAIRNVGVVNYVPAVSGDDLAKGLFEGDGVVAAETFAGHLASADYFDNVVICDSALRTQEMSDILPRAMADSLIQALDVDLLFVWERIGVEVGEGSIFLQELMSTVPTVDAVVTPVVRCYAYGRQSPLYSLNKSDTVSWELSPSLTYGQLLKDVSEYAGSMPVTYLLPHWKTLERCYFMGGNLEMRDAGTCIRENDWDGAADLWLQLYNRKKGKSKMRAAFNLAVYSEIQEDYEQAYRYLEEALTLVDEDSYEWRLIQHYRIQLKEQADQYGRLKIQMNRFE